PLPDTDFDTSYFDIRHVSWDSYIEVGGNRYSVPEALCGQPVSIRISLDDELRIYSNEKLVASHRLCSASSGWQTRLKMEHLSYHVESLLEQAAKKELNYREFLCMALQQEWNGRHQRGMESRLKQARLPWVKTLEQFDFTFQPGIATELCPGVDPG
ncbi:Mu transposase domain-containing protein, partial [Escherichia coli]|uniref:Mu transposase domain-containing protein n=1 Tax=Escherichia coli TaxID=562 RepID=UPI00207B879D